MKKTQLKDLLRNIKGQLISWLSIVVVAMMAITAFLGVRFSSKSLYDDANRIYENSNYRDIELFSTVLFDENDAEQIRKVESVEDAEGVYSVGLSVNFKNESKGVDVVSLTERINVPEVFSGRLPQDRNECALEEEVASAIGAGIGDIVTIEDPNDYLLNKSFTVVGIVCHPDNLASEGQVPGNRYVVVTKDVINKETFLDCYTKIEVLLKDAYGIIGLNSKGSANKGFLKLSPILFSPQMRLMIDLRRKHAQNEDLSAKRSAACNSGSTVSDVVPSRLLQRQSAEHTPDVDLHRSTVRYSKDVS